MSTLDNLLRQVGQKDAQLGRDLAREIKALKSRRAFGLNFERHTPESVELPGRPVRKGDKVRFLPERGAAANSVDKALWQVVGFRNSDDGRVALLARPGGQTDEPETAERLVDDLVVVAEFRDPIYPGLTSTGKVERGGDKPYHTVINAENYHALQALLYTHAGKVDAIYIDPPYNTGAKDWKYNNDYVDAEDAYRHSKWLAFMERRLLLAKRLMNPEASSLIITIDEREYLRLGLLLEQVFVDCSVQMVSSVINPTGTQRPDSLNRTDEYVYFVRRGTCGILPELVGTDEPIEVDWRTFRRQGSDNVRPTRPNQFYPIYVRDSDATIVEVGEPIAPDIDRTTVPQKVGCTTVFPIKSDGTEMMWSTLPSVTRSRLAKGYIRVGRHSPDAPQPYSIQYLYSGKIRDIEEGRAKVTGRNNDGSVVAFYSAGKEVMPTTQWNRPSHNAQTAGTALIKRLLPGRKFPFPKSLFAVEDAVRLTVGQNKQAIIVDFFAGSGTTAHAAMRLNKQDGGRRQCISVTNNEVSAEEQAGLRAKGLRPGDPEWEQWGICDYITKPRIKAAITGRTPEDEPIEGDYKFTDEFPMAEGFEENVEFFTMTYEAPRRVAHHRSFAAIAPLLWLKAGARGPRIEEAVEDFAVADAYGVLFDPDRSQGFVKALAEHPEARMAFIVTDDDHAYQAVCKALPEHIEPVRLYASYLTSFTINTGRD